MVLTYQKLIEMLRSYPLDKSNPVNDSLQCLYSDHANPTNHCIAGQILNDMGLLDEEMSEALMSFKELVDIFDLYDFFEDEEVIDIIHQLQEASDNATVCTGNVRELYVDYDGPWHYAIANFAPEALSDRE